MKSRINAALHWAIWAHDEQVRWNGEPYVLHPIRVMLSVLDRGEETAIVALLHDVLEDSKVYLPNDIQYRFGPVVGAAVDAITQGEYEDYLGEYIPRVKKNKIATVVKLADIANNLADCPLPCRNLVKYTEARRILEA